MEQNEVTYLLIHSMNLERIGGKGGDILPDTVKECLFGLIVEFEITRVFSGPENNFTSEIKSSRPRPGLQT